MTAILDELPLLLLTTAVEAVVVRLIRSRLDRPLALVDVVLLNLLSHPLAMLILARSLLPWSLIEAGVVLVEALGYRWVSRQSWKAAFLVSSIANLVTALLSFLPGLR